MTEHDLPMLDEEQPQPAAKRSTKKAAKKKPETQPQPDRDGDIEYILLEIPVRVTLPREQFDGHRNVSSQLRRRDQRLGMWRVDQALQGLELATADGTKIRGYANTLQYLGEQIEQALQAKLNS